MGKTARKILIGSGLVVIGATVMGAVSHSVTDHLMRVALDREAPRFRNMEKARVKLCGFPEADAFFKSLEQVGQKLKNSGCETVEITGYDGERLIGHWHSCENAERVIVAMHGWRSSWAKDFGIISDFWHDSRCSVLYAEQRGQNNSGGDYMGFGMLERHDCVEWVKWVNQRCGTNLPVYLAGVSMGATTVLMAAGLELPPNVHGIIADCGFTSPHAIWKHVLEHNLHLSYGIRSATVNDICRKKIQMAPGDHSTLDGLKSNRIPVLFIHGTDDHFVPVEMTYENYKACAAPKRLFVVPGADHGMSYVVDQAGYQKELLDFWHTYDRRLE